MIKIRIKILIILLGLIVTLNSCTTGDSKRGTETKVAEVLPEDIVEMREDQIKLAGIQTGSIEMRAVSNTLKANGIISVAPHNLATVSTPLGGFIKSTSLLPGMAVNKGQTLAVIENQEFVDIQQNFLETKNKLVFAEAEYKRHTDLYKNDVYSEKNVQQVTVDYKNLLAMLKSLEQKLILIGINPDDLNESKISSTVNLRSPITGYLKSVNINIGKFVSPTDVLIEIVNTERLFLELSVFEKDAQRVNAGQKIRFFVNNNNAAHEAIISQTGKSINEDKTFKVFASVVGSFKDLMPGMYVSALIEESDKAVSALPSDAIVSFDDKNYVFTFEKNKDEAGKAFTEYKMIEIKKGVSASGYTEIILPPGFDIVATRVVIKGAYNLLSAKKNAGEMAC